ncbi:MAG TPA: helix-turn-helix transcriptional regulator [Solirubrobacteraceae bacterium]|jgi:transcriptional regulator with XRE-family HTH domain|nr:helix-turn-helix transcriptional regulator [Solirubrobacteraceae bacterium]
MTLLRRELGAVLRRHREEQQRTLRSVATAAGVSLGYLSEVERGVKEASSELLSSICAALGVSLPSVLVDVADALFLAEAGSRAPVGFAPVVRAVPEHAVAPVAGEPAAVAGVGGVGVTVAVAA